MKVNTYLSNKPMYLGDTGTAISPAFVRCMKCCSFSGSHLWLSVLSTLWAEWSTKGYFIVQLGGWCKFRMDFDDPALPAIMEERT